MSAIPLRVRIELVQIVSSPLEHSWRASRSRSTLTLKHLSVEEVNSSQVFCILGMLLKYADGLVEEILSFASLAKPKTVLCYTHVGWRREDMQVSDSCKKLFQSAIVPLKALVKNALAGKSMAQGEVRGGRPSSQN